LEDCAAFTFLATHGCSFTFLHFYLIHLLKSTKTLRRKKRKHSLVSQLGNKKGICTAVIHKFKKLLTLMLYIYKFQKRGKKRLKQL